MIYRCLYLDGKGFYDKCNKPAIIKLDNYINGYCSEHIKNLTFAYNYKYVVYMFPFTNSNKLSKESHMLNVRSENIEDL